MAEKKKEKNIEELFGETEVLIKELEAGNISLDEAFAKYKEGMEKLKVCKESIDRVETQIRILSEGEAEG